MRAITVTDDHRMTLVEVDEPTAAAGEVLVDVVAAGVNRADLAQVAGHYPPPAGASEVPGLEVSGHRRDTGEPVVALLAGGGYADVVAVPTAQLLPVPHGVDLVDAAGVIEVAATVVSNLVLEGGMRIGTADDDAEDAQTVLIHGATGGVGTFATQFAAAAGARVLAVAGSAEVPSACAASARPPRGIATPSTSCGPWATRAAPTSCSAATRSTTTCACCVSSVASS